MVKYHIYLITNILNSMQYVGITGKNPPEIRWKTHVKAAYNPKFRGHKCHLERAICKYGEDSFTVEVVFSTNYPGIASSKERELIRLYSTRAPNGYNSTNGGEGTFGWVPSDIVREKMSEAGKKLWQDPKYRERMTGENNPEAKLTEKQVLQIRKLYATKKYSQEQLCKRFQVNRSCINKIVHRKRWKHLKQV